MADFREKILDKVYTVGYNLWRVEAFAEQVKALDATVVDVRYRPNSRNPDWRAGSLLKRLGRAYVWMPEFGNRNYKGGPIELVNPEEGLAKLQEIERPILPGSPDKKGLVGGILLTPLGIHGVRKEQGTHQRGEQMIRQRAISLKLDETDAAVTNFPGAAIVANLADRLGLLQDLDDFLPPKERARGLDNSAAVFDLMSIPLSGAECIEDLDQLRKDQGLERLLGRKVMPTSTAHDFLRRIRYDGLDGFARVRRRMLRRVAKSAGVTTATIDVDASLYTSTGRNARMSYKGERGYMPMLAFWEELGMIVHDDFRNGNASPGSDALPFFQETLAQLPGEVEAVRLRSDSAWYQVGVMDFCQDKGYGFCIGADQDEAVKQATMAIEEKNWQRIHLIRSSKDKGIVTC